MATTITPRRWLLLPLQHTLREFDGNALLAFEAAERGWAVLLGSKTMRYNKRLPRGVFVEKGISPGRAEKIERMIDSGHRVSAWCEEGLVYAYPEEYCRRKIDIDAYDQTDAFFCWGQQQSRDIQRVKRVSPLKMVASGNPRFDLHRSEFRAIFESSAGALRERYGPFILINTKFSKFNAHIDAEVEMTNMRRLGKVLTEEQAEEARGQVYFHKAGFEAFLRMIPVLRQCFPSHHLVIRPHPAERLDVWSRAVRVNNASVVQEGNVIEWLYAADCTIHSNCSTGVESFLLGKPSISYRPVCHPLYDLWLPNALSAEAYNEEELIQLVAACLQGRPLYSEEEHLWKKRIARCYIANAEEATACERILDVLERVDTERQSITFSPRLHSASFRIIRKTLELGLNALKGRKAYRRRRHILSSLRGLDERSLCILLRRFQNDCGRFHGVRIATLEDGVLCVWNEEALV